MRKETRGDCGRDGLCEFGGNCAGDCHFEAEAEHDYVAALPVIDTSMVAADASKPSSLSLTYGNPHGSPDERENGACHRSERRYRQGDRLWLSSRGCRCRNLRASAGAAG